MGNTNVLQRGACFTAGKIKQKQGFNVFLKQKKNICLCQNDFWQSVLFIISHKGQRRLKPK